MIKLIDGTNSLNIPTLNELRKASVNLLVKPNDIELKTSYYKHLFKFFEWYIQYCAKILSGKVYANNYIAQQIFRKIWKTENQWNQFILSSLYISKEYVEYLKSKINENNISRYYYSVDSLSIDLEKLIANTEVRYKKSVNGIYLNSDRRRNLEPKEIYLAAKTLFFIEEAENIDALYLRDLKPSVMFQMRQLLEIFGKNLLGYCSIVDNSGNEIKKFTQIAWEFIEKECKKTPSRITFPFDVDTILAINKWSNSFVHTTLLHADYIQFFALKILGELFSPKSKRTKIYLEKVKCKIDPAEITIQNYLSLKKDFEEFIKSNTVKWKDINDIEGICTVD